MKTRTYLLIPLLSVFILAVHLTTHTVSNNQGAPAGNTGSPFDNKTCARSQCHNTIATPLTGLITSNIPPSGYVPGTTYTITCSCIQPGINKWGFQVSPMNASGTLQGTLIITNALTTKIVSGKYVTHTASGTAGTGSKSWSFNWVAPLSGTGNVTFYGAFNFANGNGNSSGDFIHTSTLTIPENTMGISETPTRASAVRLSQNPFRDYLEVGIDLIKTETVHLSLLDSYGKCYFSRQQEQLPSGRHWLRMETGNLAPGIYWVLVQTGQETRMLKALKL